MVIISVSYLAVEGSRFDLDYYLGTHMPLVQKLWGPFGLTEARVLRGAGRAAIQIMALLSFPSAAEFERAVQQHGREIMADVTNFTDMKPVIQVNDLVS